MSRTMKAIGLEELGGLDVIKSFEYPVPEPKADEVLIKVEYGGVNYSDTQKRKGMYPVPLPLPCVLGIEASGTIAKLPTDEKVLSNPGFKSLGLKVGSRVAVYVETGAFAEYVATNWMGVVPFPDAVPTKEGAAIFMQGITALTFVEEAYKVQAGEYYLVHTVAGGVGINLSQLIAARGGIVIGTTSTAEKAKIAKAHGAAHVINYKTEDVAARVLEITNGQGVHAIFDGVGKDTFELNFKVIRNNGTIVLLGMASGMVAPFSPFLLLEKNVKYTLVTSANYLKDPVKTHQYYAEMFRLIQEGKLKAVVQKEYPFTVEGVREAHEALENGTSSGKLLIRIA